MSNAPKTAIELHEILRLHALWMEVGAEGKCADLSGANLSSADLSSADLRRANLRSANLRSADLRSTDLSRANLILIGQDIRGYLFYAWRDDEDVVVIRAGCREFVGIAQAREHWQARHDDDEVLHEDCLSLVDRCECMAQVRGWQLDPVPSMYDHEVVNADQEAVQAE